MGPVELLVEDRLEAVVPGISVAVVQTEPAGGRVELQQQRARRLEVAPLARERGTGAGRECQRGEGGRKGSVREPLQTIRRHGSFSYVPAAAGVVLEVDGREASRWLQRDPGFAGATAYYTSTSTVTDPRSPPRASGRSEPPPTWAAIRRAD
jgi:hypothetical protein